MPFKSIYSVIDYFLALKIYKVWFPRIFHCHVGCAEGIRTVWWCLFLVSTFVVWGHNSCISLGQDCCCFLGGCSLLVPAPGLFGRRNVSQKSQGATRCYERCTGPQNSLSHISYVFLEVERILKLDEIGLNPPSRGIATHKGLKGMFQELALCTQLERD